MGDCLTVVCLRRVRNRRGRSRPTDADRHRHDRRDDDPSPQITRAGLPALGGYFARGWISSICYRCGAVGVAAATLSVIARPARTLVMIRCDGDAQALRPTSLRPRRGRRGQRRSADVAASIHDAGAASGARRRLRLRGFGAAGRRRGDDAGADRNGTGVSTAARPLVEVLFACARRGPFRTGDERGAQGCSTPRGVPSSVNALVAAARRTIRRSRTDGDMVVPFDSMRNARAVSPAFASRAPARLGTSPTALPSEPGPPDARTSTGWGRYWNARGSFAMVARRWRHVSAQAAEAVHAREMSASALEQCARSSEPGSDGSCRPGDVHAV